MRRPAIVLQIDQDGIPVPVEVMIDEPDLPQPALPPPVGTLVRPLPATRRTLRRPIVAEA